MPEGFEGIEWGEDYTPSERVTEFGSVPALAKGYDEALTKIQSKGIIIPGEDASDEDRSEFSSTLREHLGINPPESPDEYSWKPPEGMEQHFEGMGEQLKKYHEAGYDDKTVSTIMQDQADALAAVSAQMQEQQKEIAEASEAALKEKYGDKYPDIIKNSSAMESRYPEMFEVLKTVGLANHQAIVEAMHDVSMSVREDRPPNNDPILSQNMQDELKTLKADPSYMKGNHPNHGKTIARIRELQKSLAKSR